MLADQNARARERLDYLQLLVVTHPRRAAEHDRRANTVGASLPSRLTLVDEVFNPVDEPLENVSTEVRPIALLVGALDAEVEEEAVVKGVVHHAEQRNRRLGDGHVCAYFERVSWPWTSPMTSASG